MMSDNSRYWYPTILLIFIMRIVENKIEENFYFSSISIIVMTFQLALYYNAKCYRRINIFYWLNIYNQLLYRILSIFSVSLESELSDNIALL